MKKMLGGMDVLADPLLYESLQSTIRHYLSGYLHQFLLTYGDGLLPTSLELERMWHVLNIPCCSGDWVCDMAYQNPLIELVGIDPDPRRIVFAQAQASAQGITNATFLAGRMEALAPPDQFYDLLHVRFLAPLIRRENWERVVSGWSRWCRPEGVLLWTEMQVPSSNSQAFTRWCDLLCCALERAGMTALIAPRMEQLLREAQFRDIQQVLTTIDISSSTKLHKHVCMHIWDVLNFVHCTLLFTRITRTEILHDLYEQMIQDMLSESFSGSWTFVTYKAIR